MTPAMTSSFEKGADSNQWEFHGTSFETANPLSGKQSLRLNPSTSQQYALTKNAFGVGLYVARLRVKFNSLPTESVFLAGDGSAGVKFNVSDGAIYAASASGRGVNGVIVSPDTVYVIDLKIDSSVSPWLIDAQVNGEMCGQWAQPSPAHINVRQFRIGDLNARTFDAVFDDFALSVTASDYPIGF